MCGIVGCISNRTENSSRDIILQGLQNLEYRGYDSAGFACVSAKNTIDSVKSLGQINNLIAEMINRQIDGPIGIGHIRWATHGQLSIANAHPHFDCTKSIAIVHNGIFENHFELKRTLTSEHQFQSTTDTEVVAHLIEELVAQSGSLVECIQLLVQYLQGMYACALMMQAYPDYIIALRRRAPLCIGKGPGYVFVASDTVAFNNEITHVYFMPDVSFALIAAERVQLYDFQANELEIAWQPFQKDTYQVAKGQFAHFMLKEIYEQPQVIKKTIDMLTALGPTLWEQLDVQINSVKQLRKIHLIACGTSWHAARIAKFFFETICKIPTSVHLASEFRMMPFFPEPDSMYITISQSGETADTLEALRLIQQAKLKVVALSNVASSTMVREANGYLLTDAGREVAVASTKAFTTQLAALYWLAHALGLEKQLFSDERVQNAHVTLMHAVYFLEEAIETYKQDIIEQVKKKYAWYEKYIFLGRHVSYITALEAALKLKEIAYIFSIGYPAGELKHGPIALVDEHVPVVLFSHADPLIYQKLVSNAQEVKARKGHLIIFAFEGQVELQELADWCFIFPHIDPLVGPLVMAGLMQFLVYQIALARGCPIDKPRNLAKSVTVE